MSSHYFIQDQRNNVNHLNYYYFASAFTPSELIKIRQIGDNLPKQNASVGGGDTNEVTDYRKSEIAWIADNQDTEWLYSKISDYAKTANREMWNFDVWGYQDSLQYTKLSVVLQLSDPKEYEGGELQINVGGSILSVPKELGLICFFPSFLLHRVTPLTSGVRTSLVTWLCGANLR